MNRDWIHHSWDCVGHYRRKSFAYPPSLTPETCWIVIGDYRTDQFIYGIHIGDEMRMKGNGHYDLVVWERP